MSGTVLSQAASMLREHYGPTAARDEGTAWHRLVAVVLAGDASGAPADEASGSLLGSPRETAETSTDDLANALSGVSRRRQKAGALQALARWWTHRYGDERDPIWDAPAEQLREDLRGIRGVSLELADRLLLWVGRFMVYPLDRASIRIACRHGWLGLEAEYEEWQSFFAGGLAEAGIDLRDFSCWAGAVGREFCGPQPRCERCPLRPLLPEGGPFEPDGP